MTNAYFAVKIYSPNITFYRVIHQILKLTSMQIIFYNIKYNYLDLANDLLLKKIHMRD